MEVLPTVHSHGCSYQEPGGFMRRVEEGTWAGHAIEHFALRRLAIGKTRKPAGHFSPAVPVLPKIEVVGGVGGSQQLKSGQRDATRVDLLDHEAHCLFRSVVAQLDERYLICPEALDELLFEGVE